MCQDVGNIRRLEDAGAAAVVLHSLFEEQIEIESDELDRFITESADVSAEVHQPLPRPAVQRDGAGGLPEAHRQVQTGGARFPIIASLNGTTTGGWIEYAKEMQQAGADALELNIYHIPVDPDVSGEQVEQQYVDLVHAVKNEVTHPGGRQARTVLQLHGQHGQDGWMRPAPMAWCSSTASISRISISKPWKWCPT